LISASNRDFEAMIADGTFRLDLFYRIGAVTVKLPALRERLDDIPELAALALKQFAQRHGQSPKQISEDGLRFLQNQPWPGNVRQLMHVVERAAIFSETEFIEAADFGLIASEQTETAAQEVKAGIDFGEQISTRQPEAKPGQTLVSNAVEQVEEQLIREALVRYRGNKKRIAAELGISRSYLYKRLGQMGLSSDAEE
jgi:DNA-binding NtrC family response regulator